MKFSQVADVVNLPPAIFGVGAPVVAAIPAPIGEAGKELLTVAVSLFAMFLTKAAGKLFDKWFGKDKEPKPQLKPEPQPEVLTLNNKNDGNEETKISK